MQGRRKVYILDEAHSLTTDASNALLKTLEEPPEHVVFVLCTTEPHRLLDTIKGRCQAFAFTRPTLDELGSVLRRIARPRSIEVDDAALDLIARAGRGSFRDAVSVLDQLATACDRRMALEDARALLGVVDAATLVRLTDLVAARDAAGLLVPVDELVEGGQDLGQLLSDLTEHVRNVFLDAPARPAAARRPHHRRRARRPRAAGGGVRRAHADGLRRRPGGGAERPARGRRPRLPLELLLVKLTRPSGERSVDALLRRVDALEGGAVAAPPPLSRRPRPRRRSRRREPPVPESPGVAPPPSRTAPAAGRRPRRRAHRPTSRRRRRTARADPPPCRSPPGADGGAAARRAARRRAPARGAPASRPTSTTAPSGTTRCCRRLEERPSLAATFRSAWPLALEGDVLRIAFPSRAVRQVARRHRRNARCSPA